MIHGTFIQIWTIFNSVYTSQSVCKVRTYMWPSLKIGSYKQDNIPFTDYAKRKLLPAWIREGLEKVEREKQKQLDRERKLKERQEAEKSDKSETKKVVQDIMSETPEAQAAILNKSRFVSN